MKIKHILSASILAGALLLTGCTATNPAVTGVGTPAPKPTATPGQQITPTNTSFSLAPADQQSDLIALLGDLPFDEQNLRWTEKDDKTIIVYIGGSSSSACSPSMDIFGINPSNNKASLHFEAPKGNVACTADFTIHPYIFIPGSGSNINDFTGLEVCNLNGQPECQDLKKI